MRPAIYAALLCTLLAVATSASAGCAWVLWMSPLAGETHWVPLSAFESKQECEGYYREVFPQGPGTFTMHNCLPDTVDPRGPKGGK